MDTTNEIRGGVLILPGGRARDTTASRVWQLANQRMIWLAWSLRRHLGGSVRVDRVQYRKRGWNSPDLDPLRDAEAALERMRDAVGGPIILVGHSMGGRVAAHLSHHKGVSGVVALAPWWPHDDADLVPTDCRLLALHGIADTWTDSRASQAQIGWAHDRGVDARWIGIPNAGHFMLRHLRQWHRLTADFVTERLRDPMVG